MGKRHKCSKLSKNKQIQTICFCVFSWIHIGLLVLVNQDLCICICIINILPLFVNLVVPLIINASLVEILAATKPVYRLSTHCCQVLQTMEQLDSISHKWQLQGLFQFTVNVLTVAFCMHMCNNSSETYSQSYFAAFCFTYVSSCLRTPDIYLAIFKGIASLALWHLKNYRGHKHFRNHTTTVRTTP